MYLAYATLTYYGEDGTMLRFVDASPPDVPRYMRANEEGEKSTCCIHFSGTDSELTFD